NGYLAANREQELRCRTQFADVLMEMENVTAKLESATRNLDAKAANDARKRTLTQLEQECETASQTSKTGRLKCETVDLYQGGQYWLYKYKRYDDVRLVFAPEYGIAAFGGDPDNFQFPRWCLDMSVLRAYDANGKPVIPLNHLQIDVAGPQPGELVFVSGHPGSTDRLLTVAQLEELRDVALLDDRLLARKKAEEQALRVKVAADPQLAASTGDPWADIERAEVVDQQ